MSNGPFQIRLNRAADEDLEITNFSLLRKFDTNQMTRRTRTLSALTGLSSKQRTAFSKAVSDTCRMLSENGIAANARFSVAQVRGTSIARVDFSATDGEASLPSASLDRLRSTLELIYCFDITEQPLRIALSQLAPRSIRLSNDDVQQWAELLNANSLEDAISIAQVGRQQSNAELGIARSYGGSEEAARQAISDRDDLETLSLVVSRCPIAILVMSEEGLIQWANSAFAKLSGYSEAEAIGRSCDELLFGPSTEASAVRAYQQSLRNGHEMKMDLMQYRRDGRTFWVEFRLIPIHDAAGQLSRWIGIQADVTQRRQTEEALKAAKQSAETSSRAKSEFLANMSHEIRTPLNAVVGMTELALSTHLTVEQRDYLQCVQTSADTLLGLLNDVLDVSKIEAGKMEIESTVFNIAELIRETLKALAVKAHEKGLELAVHMPMDIPQFMEGDPIRIRQVLFNLVGNAIKFTEQGEVVVDVEQQWTTDKEVCLHFVVRDTGIGIPRDRLQKIFESFTQVDSSMARRFGGTGLGLTITSELIRMMEGKIWVQSSLGEGSTFHFTIQLKLANPPDAATVGVDASDLQGKTALVVDDNATNRRILDEMLRHWGIQPTLADGADAALVELSKASAACKPFDLILLDAMMPRVDGFQLAETIKNRGDLQCGTVMMLSSADRPNSAARCRQLGIETYLVKPVSASALLEAILDRLSGLGSRKFNDHESGTGGGLSISDQAARKLKILVVDDHEPNRKLAIRILQRRGHQCEAAADGDEAIAAYSQKQFDLILMDVQMPKCDGLAATRRIRELDKQSKTQTPIVALTAHALTGDREKCLAAGMDSYLSKPIHARELIALIERLTGDGKTIPAQTNAKQLIQTKGFSFSAALDRMNGETDLLIEHIGYVMNDAPQLMATIREAIKKADARSLQIASHRLKSLVGTYNHDEARDLAYALEMMGKEETFDNATETLARLDSHVSLFVKAIRDYSETHASQA